MLLIVDIDGTIAELKDRIAIAGQEPDRTDKAAFQHWLDMVQSEELLAKDKVISEVTTLVHTMYRAGHKIVYLTGRAERYRNVTKAWLKQNHLVGKLWMRQDNDWSSAGDYKFNQLKKILIENMPDTALAIDDDPTGDTSVRYSELGIVHLKVMERHGDLHKTLKQI